MKELMIDGLTLDERVARINKATEDIKQGFMIIACEMTQAKKEWKGRNPEFLAYIEEKTGYKQRSVYHFLNSKVAMDNLSEFCTAVQKLPLPDSEWVIRPLAVKRLNENPERQARVWSIACEYAAEDGDKQPTEKHVKEALGAEEREFHNITEFRTKPIVYKVDPTTIFEDDEKKLLRTILRKAGMTYHPDHGGDEEIGRVYINLMNKFNEYIKGDL